MKLWKKISLICSVVLIVIVAACSTLLLVQSRNTILELTYAQVENKLKNLSGSFAEMARYYASETDSESANYALIQYCFSRFADETSVLIKDAEYALAHDIDGEILYSEVSLLPEDFVLFAGLGTYDRPYEAMPCYTFFHERTQQQLCISYNKVDINQTHYSVYVVEDVTPVYNDIAAMIWKFAIISIAGIALGVALTSLLVRRSMQPLTRLSASAKRIAAGGYGERADLASRDEVGALAGDFNAMAAAVESHIAELTETAERQRLFIGGVTHEFKTPLTTMLLNADTLQNAHMDEEERLTALAYIQRQCQWLERLTQKLLKLITLKARIKMERVNVPRLFERVKESMTETLAQRGTSLMTECDTESMELDADLMQSVLVNLVDNASKASAPGQAVTLRAYGNSIEVEDRGCGIPKGELERIMEPFYMVDKSRSKKNGGTGLGLALVREIVTAHGAVLEVESEVGKGSIFRILFKR